MAGSETPVNIDFSASLSIPDSSRRLVPHFLVAFRERRLPLDVACGYLAGRGSRP